MATALPSLVFTNSSPGTGVGRLRRSLTNFTSGGLSPAATLAEGTIGAESVSAAPSCGGVGGLAIGSAPIGEDVAGLPHSPGARPVCVGLSSKFIRRRKSDRIHGGTFGGVISISWQWAETQVSRD